MGLEADELVALVSDNDLVAIAIEKILVQIDLSHSLDILIDGESCLETGILSREEHALWSTLEGVGICSSNGVEFHILWCSILVEHTFLCATRGCEITE